MRLSMNAFVEGSKIGVRGERREDRAGPRLTRRPGGCEEDSAPVPEVQAEDAAVPLPERVFVLALEEDTADAENLRHGRGR